MAWIALILGTALVWVFGTALVYAAHGRDPRVYAPGETAWNVGCGWFVGLFLLTVWMRTLSAIHVPFGLAVIALPLIAFTAGAAWIAWRAAPPWSHWQTAARTIFAPDLPRWQRTLWLALLAWLAVRFALLLIEVARRPLYAWDSWTQWGTKARVWYELRRIAPFVAEPEWFAAGNPSVYFDAAPLYPGTVPLFQVWPAILIGRWDDALVNLPWWVTGVAFGLAVYGYLAREGFAPLTALVGTWLVLSLPILDTHIALAGYADLAMASYLTLTAAAALAFVRTRRRGEALIAVVLAAACVLIKNPGKVWLAVLVPGLLVAASPRYGRRIAAIALGVAALAVLVLARTDAFVLGYRLHLDFDMPWGGLYDAYFALGNWHLLWYGAIVIALLAWRELLVGATAPYTVMVAAGVLFLLFGFAFTNARLWVEDQSTVNRATLHLAPLVIVWMLVAFRQWAARHAAQAKAAPGTTPSAIEA